MPTFPTAGQQPYGAAVKAYIDAAAAGGGSSWDVWMPVPSGGDDTSAMQTVLTTGAGKQVRGRPGASYIISAPLVIASGTTLDMTSCTVTLAAASNCNMLNNTAVSTVQRSVTDAAITTGTTTLTSATASFTSADVGRSVVITGAMTAGTGTGGVVGPLCVQITGFTNSTTVTVSAAASATVSGAAMSIYNRDSDITIRGGTWDRGVNSGTTTGLHSLRFRRVDRLTFDGTVRIKTGTGSKYGISVGSCTVVRGERIDFNTVSDGFHIEGDVQYVRLGTLTGTTGDDFVACTSRSAPTYPYEDVAGDIRDIVIDSLEIVSSKSPFKILGGAGTVCSGFKVRNILNEGTGQVSIGAEDPTVYIQDIRDVAIDNFTTATYVGCNVLGNVTDLTLRNLRMTDNTSSSFGVNVAANSTLTNLVVDGVDSRGSGTGNAIVRLAASTSTLARVKVANVYWTPGASSYVLLLSAAASITSATLDKVTLVNGGGFVSATSGTLTRVRLDNCESSGSSWGLDLGTTSEVFLSNVTNDSPSNGFANIRAAAVATFRGNGNHLSGGLSVAAGGKVTSYTSDVPYSATAGAVPTVAVAAGAGTGATATITGNDACGSITVTTGTGTATGDLCTITFVTALGAAARQIQITPTNATAAAANPYVSTKSTSLWRIGCQTAPGASGSATFDYVVTA